MTSEKWLVCQISEGQFPGEVVVSGDTFNRQPFSLFCSEEYVQSDNALGDDPRPGLVKVVCLDQKADLVLVKLPQQTLENGLTITVKSSDLRAYSEHQRA